jgi:hypothetical protein
VHAHNPKPGGCGICGALVVRWNGIRAVLRASTPADAASSRRNWVAINACPGLPIGREGPKETGDEAQETASRA